MTKYAIGILRWGIVVVILDSVFKTITTPILVILPQYIIDALAARSSHDFFLSVLLFAIVGILIYGIEMLLRYYSGQVMRGAFLAHDLFFSGLRCKMSYEDFQNPQYMDDEQSIKGDTDPFNYFKHQLYLVECIVNIIVFSSIISQVHPIVFIVIIMASVLNLFIHNQIQKYDYSADNLLSSFQRKKEYLQNLMMSFDHAKEIRINHVRKWLSDKLRDVLMLEFKSKMNLRRKRYPLDVLQCLIEWIQTVIIYLFAAVAVLANKITIGAFSTYIASITKLKEAWNGTVTQLITMKYTTKYIQRLMDYTALAQSPAISSNDGYGIDLQKEHHILEFVNVSFQYPGAEEYTLKNVSFQLETGKTVALVGFNGAGKTTVIKLMCGLYRPNEGKILFDGRDIWTIDMDAYHDIMSVIWQDYCIFPLSIKENIVLDQPFEAEKWHKALSDGGLDECMEAFPDGFETCVGKDVNRNAVELSGGQAQCLVFSRLAYRNTPIIVLDEPTVSLDPYTEMRIYHRYQTMMENKIGILISHRMSFCSLCDRILYLHSGCITESGTHTELMNKGGAYSQLFHAQAQYYQVKE